MTDRERRGTDDEVVLRAAEVGAVLFDLDGVLTDTASVHASAWQRLFDAVFAEHRERTGAVLAPFDADTDYHALVDGRLRQEGVGAVLASRGVELPTGSIDDPPTAATVWGLANRKQAFFEEVLAARGVRVVPGAIELVTRLRRAGIRMGVVTSSRNADAVLRAAHLDRFEVIVDGVDVALRNLPGKPHPASFLEAAARLGVAPTEVALFEDATAGVAAGVAGGFGQVIGVGTGESAARLVEAGATACVPDLKAVTVHADPWFGRRSPEWVLEFDEKANEAWRETLCTLGNGYMATRGAVPESVADDVHHPGTYAAGIYNRLVTNVHGHELEHEDLVNVPNWLPLTFRVEGGEWFGAPSWRIREDRHRLDLRSGLLHRRVRASDEVGRHFVIDQVRLVSMRSRHLAALRTTISLEGPSAVRIEIRTAIDGRVANSGVREYRPLLDRHLIVTDVDVVGDTMLLRARTNQSRIEVAVAARTTFTHDSVRTVGAVQLGSEWVAQLALVDLEPGRPCTIDKTAAIHTGRDHAISEPGLAAFDAASSSAGWDALVDDHRAAWEELWPAASLSVESEDRTQSVVNLHLFHLLQSVSPLHTVDLDVGVTARGLHGEAYRGHVFWDELFVLPLLSTRFPLLTRSLLLYRYRRLDCARGLASGAGHAGAMFPWQSGSDGSEETPVRFFNVRSGRWMADNSENQRHVSLAIAHNVWRYVQATGDTDFLRRHGVEMLVEIARFWVSIAAHDPSTDRYDIGGVMGPDEFHDGYPDRPGEGVINNTYTNVLTSWVLCRAIEAVEACSHLGVAALWERLDLRPEELEHWDRVSRNLRIEFDPDGRLDQFRGYHRLAEFDWDHYRRTYDNIGRLDLILEAEGDSTNRYQLSKQADVLMLFYLFSSEELTAQLDHLGYPFDPATIPATVHHYLERTSHGSTLCRVVHSWVLARTDREHSWQLFCDALGADVDHTPGGTTGEGIHLGAMTGTVDLLERCYSGLEITDVGLRLGPRLPPALRRLRFPLLVRGHRLDVDIDREGTFVRSRSAPDVAPIEIVVSGLVRTLAPGDALSFPTGGETASSTEAHGRELEL